MKLGKLGKKTITLVLALLMLFDQGAALFAPISDEGSVLLAEQQEARIEPVDVATDAPPSHAVAAPQAAPTAHGENPIADSDDETVIAVSGNLGAPGEDIAMPVVRQDAPIVTNTLRGTRGEADVDQEVPTLSIPLVDGPLSASAHRLPPIRSLRRTATAQPHLLIRRR